MRIAIYARYSDELQSALSIDDQLRLCREFAERTGLGEIVQTYADPKVSGASLITRPAAQRLLADCKARDFDVVLIESLDRLSRDQEDIASIYKRVVFAGAKLVSVAEGEIGELQIGFKGTMNAVFLRDLALKVRRGQTGRALAGASPGGVSYGYRVVREFDPKGEPVHGKREIDPNQAVVIRRIAAEYISGKSPRAIAVGLNRDGIPAPRGGAWGPASIAGGRGRASGILFNALYVGRLVYNRTHFVRDPDTGKRLSRPNARQQWVTAEVPALRILDDSTWRRIEERHALHAGRPAHLARRPKHAFSGLLYCAVCGSSYTVRDAGKVGCTGRHDRGTCSNGTRVRIAELETRVLAGLTARLLQPDAVAAYVEEYHRERQVLRANERRQRVQRERRLNEIVAALDRLIDQVAKGLLPGERVTARMAELEAERAALAAELAATAEPDIVTLHPKTIERYRARIAELGAALAGTAGDARRAAAIAIAREFIDRIEIGPPEHGGAPARIVAHGLLPRVLGYAAERQQAAGRGIKGVAGEGFEPPTLGL